MQSTAKKLSLYLSIDYDFLDDPKVLALTGWAFKTLMYLLRYKDGKRLNGWTIPVAQETLASKVNCTGKSLRKYIKELETAGFITSKNTQKRVYRIETQAREILPRASVNITDISNIRLNNITNPPTTASITKRKLGAKEGEGKLIKVKQALISKSNSYVPPDREIEKILDQIPTDNPIDTLVDAIQKVDIDRIAHLPKLFDAARKKEGPFWVLIKGHQERLDADEHSKQAIRKTRADIDRIKQPDQTKPDRDPPKRNATVAGFDRVNVKNQVAMIQERLLRKANAPS